MTKTDPESAVCPPGYKMVLEADINKVSTGPLATMTDLPREVVELVIKCIREDRHFKTLTRLARVNQDYYDLVIPTLYETVVVNDGNRYRMDYGHGHKSQICGDAKSDGTTPTRKDVATTFTRLMVINDLPNTPFPKSFTGVKEVRFGGRCFENQEEEDDDRYRDPYHDYDDYLYQDTYDPDQVPTLLKDCLLAIAPTSISPYSLQVKFQIGPNHNFDELESLLRQLNPPIPFTYEFHFKKMSHTDYDALQLAYKHGGIVHYEYPATYYNPDTVAQNIADHLGSLFFEHVAGRVYLCDVPRLVLTPKEHHVAGDNVNETAKRRIFYNIRLGNDSSMSTSLNLARWRVFDNRVKLVEPGFRPSTKTLISDRKRGSEWKNSR